MPPHVTEANRAKLIVSSGFAGYDHCLNPYVGCQFGCHYCYVRFFIKDKAHAWGGFVRTRSYIPEKLPKELRKIGPTRLVLGTMTDPYQPIEKKFQLTRAALEAIANGPRMRKVGIFTRSPLVLRDIDLLKQIEARVHVTIAPLDDAMMAQIEPYPIKKAARWDMVARLRDEGIRVHVSVAPALPLISEHLVDEFAHKLAGLQVAEFFVDPCQPYAPAIEAIDAQITDDRWPKIRAILFNKPQYNQWKQQFRERWAEAWAKVRHLSPMPLASDHQNRLKLDMNTGKEVNWDTYDQYENQP